MCTNSIKETEPDAPYRVFGYNDLCENFDIPIYTFVEAVRTFQKLDNGMNVIFIEGVSDKVQLRLKQW